MVFIAYHVFFIFIIIYYTSIFSSPSKYMIHLTSYVPPSPGYSSSLMLLAPHLKIFFFFFFFLPSRTHLLSFSFSETADLHTFMYIFLPTFVFANTGSLTNLICNYLEVDSHSPAFSLFGLLEWMQGRPNYYSNIK